MFHSFLSKLAVELSNEHFCLITNVNGSVSYDRAAIYGKDESPVFYFVAIYDFDKITTEKLHNFLIEHENSLLRGSLFSSIICVNILYSNDLEAVASFSNSMEEPRDIDIHNVWWYTDGSKLYSGNGQPDKVYGIERCVERAISAGHSSNGDIEEISRKAFDKARLTPTGVFPAVTAAVITSNIIIFLLGQGNDFMYRYGLNGELIFHSKQYFRLFTYMFIHADVEHILLNMISMFIYGTRIEKYFGGIDTIAIYFLSGFAGGILSALNNTGFAVGASGAIFGLMGALLIISKITRQRIDGLGYMSMLVVAVANIGLGYTNISVDNYGHIGGLLMGMAIGVLIGKTKKE
ncbi:rhomboid protease GluP [Clostridiales bacterium]|nr:rhomboid protease GluP [Clostridiales bacterium]